MSARTKASTPMAVATVAFVVMLATGVPDRDIALRLWLVALGAVGARVVIGVLLALPAPARHDRYERATSDPEPPAPLERPSLVRAGRLVSHISGTAGDLHFRARPALRDVARARLADRGLDLDDPADRDEVAGRCGPLLWAVVRPDRPEPDDRHGPGLRRSDAPDLIAHLEAL